MNTIINMLILLSSLQLNNHDIILHQSNIEKGFGILLAESLNEPLWNYNISEADFFLNEYLKSNPQSTVIIADNDSTNSKIEDVNEIIKKLKYTLYFNLNGNIQELRPKYAWVEEATNNILKKKLQNILDNQNYIINIIPLYHEFQGERNLYFYVIVCSPKINLLSYHKSEILAKEEGFRKFLALSIAAPLWNFDFERIDQLIAIYLKHSPAVAIYFNEKFYTDEKIQIEKFKEVLKDKSSEYYLLTEKIFPYDQKNQELDVAKFIYSKNFFPK